MESPGSSHLNICNTLNVSFNPHGGLTSVHECSGTQTPGAPTVKGDSPQNLGGPGFHADSFESLAILGQVRTVLLHIFDLICNPKVCQTLLTLLRAFGSRVTFALAEKDVPYDSVLIDLRDKPAWYKEIIPTALTPAARINGELVWESMDILQVTALCS